MIRSARSRAASLADFDRAEGADETVKTPITLLVPGFYVRPYVLG
jgi:hypothetical protein